ncbi:Anaphase-promoting complex subunit, partial [Parasponia andersonii]
MTCQVLHNNALIFFVVETKMESFAFLTSLISQADMPLSLVALSKDLCRLVVMCSGKLIKYKEESENKQMTGRGMHGLHCLVLVTSIFWKRKNELHQVVKQASNIEEMTEVIRVSLSVMSKQWSNAMHTFLEKFDSLSNLIVRHGNFWIKLEILLDSITSIFVDLFVLYLYIGLDSSSQEEFSSLLDSVRTSLPVHQFLVNSLGEVGVKHVSKVICEARKELQLIVLNHLQDWRIKRWRACYQSIGLDETLISTTTTKIRKIIVQVEWFMRLLSFVVQQECPLPSYGKLEKKNLFRLNTNSDISNLKLYPPSFSNFFNWLLKCIKILMQESSDQSASTIQYVYLHSTFTFQVAISIPFRCHSSGFGNELLIFKQYDITKFFREALSHFGGFSDCEYLRKKLAKQFHQKEFSFKEAFLMPFTSISRKILCVDLLLLVPLPYSPVSLKTPTSISYYEMCQCSFKDFISFQIPHESFSNIANCIAMVKVFTHDSSTVNKGNASLEALLLHIFDGYHCVDLSLYKESQLVFLLNDTTSSFESSRDACMMIVQATDLPFASISRSTYINYWKLHELK